MQRVVQQNRQQILNVISNQFLRSKSAPAAENEGVLKAYQRLVDGNNLLVDATQLAAVQALQVLQDALAIRAHTRAAPAAAATATGTSESVSTGSTTSGMTTGSERPLVQGAYLFGPVGSGKTFLMDLFLNTLPTRAPNSSNDPYTKVALTAHRLHYHEWMLFVHERLHKLQQALPRTVALSRSGLPVYRYAPPQEDPVLLVGRDAAAGLDLLCLDELHVTDVADAMLLARLVGEVLRCGCAVVFTSNRPPHQLYQGGLSRKYFEPFISLIDNSLMQLKVAGSRDYRLLQAAKQQREKQPLGPVESSSSGMWLLGSGAQQQLQQYWQQLLAQQQAQAPTQDAVTEGPSQIRLPFGRSLYLPRSLLQHQQRLLAAFFSFEELCGDQGCRSSLAHAGALSANDYLALVRSCRNIFLSGLRQLRPADRDAARRLVTLIDLLYEAHSAAPGAVRLFVSAEVEPAEVFLPLLGAAARQGVNPNIGRASSSRLNVKQLLQAHPGQPVAPHELSDTTGGRDSGSSEQPAESEMLSSALLPEEVLMYHRASSRLTELCSVLVAEAAQGADDV